MRPGAPGRLFLVPAPLGDPEDLSVRAARVLAAVDVIAAETPARTRRLLAALGIADDGRVVAYHEPSPDEIAGHLRDGLDVALIPDAGTPGVSDPGTALVQRAIALGCEIRPLAGPCAATVALSASGLPATRFLFLGFPPRHLGKLAKLLRSIADRSETLVLYVAANRADATLQVARDALGERRACLAGELSRPGERLVHGRLGALVGVARAGDWVLGIEGAPPDEG